MHMQARLSSTKATKTSLSGGATRRLAATTVQLCGSATMSASPSTEADKFDSVLDSVLQQLHTSDTNKVATTCAALAMLVSQAPSSVQNLSAKVMPEATRLLHTEHTLVQVSASAVLPLI